MANNPDCFVVLEERDTRDRNKEDVAYTLSETIRDNLKTQLKSILQFADELNAKEEELKSRAVEIDELNRTVDKYKSQQLKIKIVLDIFMATIILGAGVLCIFWIDQPWNYIGRWVSSVFSKDNPLINNILSTLVVYGLTSPFIARRLSHHIKALSLIRSHRYNSGKVDNSR